MGFQSFHRLLKLAFLLLLFLVSLSIGSTVSNDVATVQTENTSSTINEKDDLVHHIFDKSSGTVIEGRVNCRPVTIRLCHFVYLSTIHVYIQFKTLHARWSLVREKFFYMDICILPRDIFFFTLFCSVMRKKLNCLLRTFNLSPKRVLHFSFRML